MVDDGQRPDHAANHVKDKPRFGRAKALEGLDALSEGIDQQQQHENSAHQPKVVAKVGAWLVPITAAYGDRAGDEQRRQCEPDDAATDSLDCWELHLPVGSGNVKCVKFCHR